MLGCARVRALQSSAHHLAALVGPARLPQLSATAARPQLTPTTSSLLLARSGPRAHFTTARPPGSGASGSDGNTDDAHSDGPGGRKHRKNGASDGGVPWGALPGERLPGSGRRAHDYSEFDLLKLSRPTDMETETTLADAGYNQARLEAQVEEKLYQRLLREHEHAQLSRAAGEYDAASAGSAAAIEQEQRAFAARIPRARELEREEFELDLSPQARAARAAADRAMGEAWQEIEERARARLQRKIEDDEAAANAAHYSTSYGAGAGAGAGPTSRTRTRRGGPAIMGEGGGEDTTATASGAARLQSSVRTPLSAAAALRKSPVDYAARVAMRVHPDLFHGGPANAATAMVIDESSRYVRSVKEREDLRRAEAASLRNTLHGGDISQSAEGEDAAALQRQQEHSALKDVFPQHNNGAHGGTHGGTHDNGDGRALYYPLSLDLIRQHNQEQLALLNAALDYRKAQTSVADDLDLADPFRVPDTATAEPPRGGILSFYVRPRGRGRNADESNNNNHNNDSESSDSVSGGSGMLDLARDLSDKYVPKPAVARARLRLLSEPPRFDSAVTCLRPNFAANSAEAAANRLPRTLPTTNADADSAAERTADSDATSATVDPLAAAAALPHVRLVRVRLQSLTRERADRRERHWDPLYRDPAYLQSLAQDENNNSSSSSSAKGVRNGGVDELDEAQSPNLDAGERERRRRERAMAPAGVIAVDTALAKLVGELGDEASPAEAAAWLALMQAQRARAQWNKSAAGGANPAMNRYFGAQQSDTTNPVGDDMAEFASSPRAWAHLFYAGNQERSETVEETTHARYFLLEAMMAEGFVTFDPAVAQHERLLALKTLRNTVMNKQGYALLNGSRWWSRRLTRAEAAAEAARGKYGLGTGAGSDDGSPAARLAREAGLAQDEDAWPQASKGFGYRLRVAVHFLPPGASTFAPSLTLRTRGNSAGGDSEGETHELDLAPGVEAFEVGSGALAQAPRVVSAGYKAMLARYGVTNTRAGAITNAPLETATVAARAAAEAAEAASVVADANAAENATAAASDGSARPRSLRLLRNGRASASSSSGSASKNREPAAHIAHDGSVFFPPVTSAAAAAATPVDSTGTADDGSNDDRMAAAADAARRRERELLSKRATAKAHRDSLAALLGNSNVTGGVAGSNSPNSGSSTNAVDGSGGAVAVRNGGDQLAHVPPEALAQALKASGCAHPSQLLSRVAPPGSFADACLELRVPATWEPGRLVYYLERYAWPAWDMYVRAATLDRQQQDLDARDTQQRQREKDAAVSVPRRSELRAWARGQAEAVVAEQESLARRNNANNTNNNSSTDSNDSNSGSGSALLDGKRRKKPPSPPVPQGPVFGSIAVTTHQAANFGVSRLYTAPQAEADMRFRETLERLQMLNRAGSDRVDRETLRAVAHRSVYGDARPLDRLLAEERAAQAAERLGVPQQRDAFDSADAVARGAVSRRAALRDELRAEEAAAEQAARDEAVAAAEETARLAQALVDERLSVNIAARKLRAAGLSKHDAAAFARRNSPLHNLADTVADDDGPQQTRARKGADGNDNEGRGASASAAKQQPLWSYQEPSAAASALSTPTAAATPAAVKPVSAAVAPARGSVIVSGVSVPVPLGRAKTKEELLAEMRAQLRAAGVFVPPAKQKPAAASASVSASATAPDSAASVTPATAPTAAPVAASVAPAAAPAKPAINRAELFSAALADTPARSTADLTAAITTKGPGASAARRAALAELKARMARTKELLAETRGGGGGGGGPAVGAVVTDARREYSFHARSVKRTPLQMTVGGQLVARMLQASRPLLARLARNGDDADNT